MYIYPDSEVKILHNVNLNNDYDHTIYFSSATAQQNFFTNNLRVKYSLTNQQYQRKERGWIQVNLNQNQLWDCTYLMYKNSHYTIAPSQTQGTSLKWFYAFILSVEYVNESVSKINYEIDVIQTWMFDYVLDKCYVEREHSASDNYYENTIEENLDLGSGYWIHKNYEYDLDCTRVAVVESGHYDQSLDKFVGTSPTRMGKYFTGLHYQSYDLKDLDTSDPNYPNSSAILKAHLYDFVQHGVSEAIVSVYQYPRFMGYIPNTTADSNFDFSYTDISFTPEITNFAGYYPKNKKLFTYPYTFIELDDMHGHTSNYKLEYWYPNTHAGEFRLFGTPFGIPTCLCVPRFYNGEQTNYQNGLSIQLNIQSPWVGDAYQVWLARNEKNIEREKKIGAAMVAVGIAGSLIGVISGNSALQYQGVRTSTSGGSRLFNAINQNIERKNELEMTPAPVYGQTVDEMLNLQMGIDSIAFRQKSIRAEYAKIIDEYFSRFGYACHRVKVPNIHVRQNWTYTKTIGCEIVGNLPSDDIVKIKSIYDNGITFWTDGMNIGNYSDFTNPVLS